MQTRTMIDIKKGTLLIPEQMKWPAVLVIEQEDMPEGMTAWHCIYYNHINGKIEPIFLNEESIQLIARSGKIVQGEPEQ